MMWDECHNCNEKKVELDFMQNQLDSIRLICEEGMERQKLNRTLCIENNHPKEWFEEFGAILYVYEQIYEVLEK